MQFRDTAGTLVPAMGCTSVDPNTVRCDWVRHIWIWLGDRNDTLDTSTSVFSTIYGGPGRDQITGGPHGESMNGGEGDDTLTGNGDEDSLTGGAGNDVLNGGDGRDYIHDQDGDDTIDAGQGDDEIEVGLGRDTIDGGWGRDLVSYGWRQVAGVRVSLDGVANDGVVGEGDNVMATVEDLRGTAGPDVLIGSSGPNELHGHTGNDDVRGMAGDDTLWAYPGAGQHSTLNGGDGTSDRCSPSGVPNVTRVNCELP